MFAISSLKQLRDEVTLQLFILATTEQMEQKSIIFGTLRVSVFKIKKKLKLSL
jgi:hypothetical protein